METTGTMKSVPQPTNVPPELSPAVCTTNLLRSELLHQPLLLPQHLVLLAQLPQQLLLPGRKEKIRER